MLDEKRDSSEDEDSLEIPIGSPEQVQESCDIRDEVEGTDGKWETLLTNLGKLGNNDPKISDVETDQGGNSDHKKRWNDLSEPSNK